MRIPLRGKSSELLLMRIARSFDNRMGLRYVSVSEFRGVKNECTGSAGTIRRWVAPTHRMNGRLEGTLSGLVLLISPRFVVKGIGALTGASEQLGGDAVSEAVAEAGEMPASTTIGEQGFLASTDTSKGTIKIYSSWPLTGSMEGTGGDAVVAAQMAFDDFGNASGGYALSYEALDDGVAANNGGWEAGKETENVNKVDQRSRIAMVYMGTYNSGAAQDLHSHHQQRRYSPRSPTPTPTRD